MPPTIQDNMSSGFRRVRAWIEGIGIRQIRIACGSMLFAYLLSHFTNHALGNISYGAMEAGLDYHMGFWRNPVVAVVFYTAAITHWSLGLWALYERRQFRYPLSEISQLVLGVSIPFLLVTHFVGSRLQTPLFGRDSHYAQVLIADWVNRPYMHWIQFTLLIVAWIHGCIGLYFWLRLKRFFRPAAPFLLSFAVLMPTLALLGLVQGAREAISLYGEPAWRAANFPPARLPTAAERTLLDSIAVNFVVAYAGILGLIFAARGVRALHERRHGMITLSYANGHVVRVPKGTSVLEASLQNKIPHASVCGGKARCSTCRIRVTGDFRTLPRPSRRESFVLERVGASADPAVRLACQLRPQADIAFQLLFPPRLDSAAMHRSTRLKIGEERYIVSMFIDMRRSIGIAEKRLPFDTMYLINRFIAAVCQAVEDAGGRPNQFVGDGVLALFGLDKSPEVACRQAVDGAARIAANIEQLNKELAHDLREPIRIGIGINGGNAIIGDIGHKEHMIFTALGDSVNVAARLQDLAKDLACEVLISEDVCQRAGLSRDGESFQQVKLRGRNDSLGVYAAQRARQLCTQEGE
jgi:adenylate cyclase